MEEALPNHPTVLRCFGRELRIGQSTYLEACTASTSKHRCYELVPCHESQHVLGGSCTSECTLCFIRLRKRKHDFLHMKSETVGMNYKN